MTGGTATSDRGGRVAGLLVCAALTVVAGLSWHRVFPLDALLVPVLAAGLAPCVVLALASVRTRPLSLWITAAMHPVVWVVGAGALFLGQPPTSTTLHDLWDGLSGSWLSLLTTVLPAPAEPRLLVGLAGAVYLAGAAGAELVVRTRSGVAAAAPSAVLLLAGALIGVGGPGDDLPVATAYAVLVATMFAVRSGRAPGVPRSGTAGLLRRVALIAVTVVLAGAAGVFVGPRLAGPRPYDLRRHMAAQVQPYQAVNPLDQVAAWLATPNLVLFDARSATAENWRIATLDQFDGITWRSSGQFVPTGERVPPVFGSAPTRTVTASVTVDTLTGPWLPAPESPVDIVGTPALVDPDDAVLLSVSGLQPALTYTVTSHVATPAAGALRLAVPAQDPATTGLPAGLPQSIVDRARTATQGATFPFQQAVRLENYLATTEVNDLTAPPGHTYGHLAYFLNVSHRGTTEQFATAFAVMARALGLPTRIAVGFGPGIARPGGGWLIRGHDALVWPEVAFAGLGWVPFYPTPSVGSRANGTVSTPAGAPAGRDRIDADLNADRSSAASPQLPGPDGTAAASAGAGADWWWALLAVPALCLAYLTAAAVAPWLRSVRRRGARGERALVAAAWADLLPRLAPLDLGNLAVLTTGEVAVRASRRLDRPAAERLRSLAELADAAGFSGAPPAQGSGTDAWDLARRLRRPVVAAAGLRAVMRERLRPTRVFIGRPW
jgi:transglutaminase-like putative cysteine protease